MNGPDDDETRADPVAIPYTQLSEDALRGVIESFVLREGTDYGQQEFTLDQKVARVVSQLDRGQARVMFDPNTETVDIVVVAPGQRSRSPE
jgi:uncharacterized protein YheU (UPF0270 family)